jgi:hypothetical protein
MTPARQRLSARAKGRYRQRALRNAIPIAIVTFVSVVVGGRLHPSELVAYAASSPAQVTVDFSVDEGPVTHRASGFFNIASVPDDMVRPLKPRLVTWVPWLRQDYHRAKELGAQFQLKLGSAGIMGNRPWPGDNGDWSRWEGAVREKVSEVVRGGHEVQYDIWNEPDVEWRPLPPDIPLRERGPERKSRSYDQYLEMWRRTVVLIRGLDSRAVIVGPSSLAFQFVMGKFLPFAVRNNVLPDVLSWHSLQEDRGSNLVGQVTAVRQYLTDQRITTIKSISINEYLGAVDVTNAGVAVKFFYELERAKVDSAAKACFEERRAWVCIPQLNNLLEDPQAGLRREGQAREGQTKEGERRGSRKEFTRDVRPRSIWWAYKGYADITGRLVRLVPSDDVYGVAGHNSTTGEARVVLGRTKGHSGDVSVGFVGLDRVSFLVDKRGVVRVEAEHIVASGAASSSPVRAISKDYMVSANTLYVALPSFGPADAYTVILRSPERAAR